MLSTSMRRWTWNSAPTWMTLGTQYSSMLLNWAGGRGLVGAQRLPAQSWGLPQDLESFTPLGLGWSWGRIQPKK